MVNLTAPPHPLIATQTLSTGSRSLISTTSWQLGALTISLGLQSRGLPPEGKAFLLIPTTRPLTVQQGHPPQILKTNQDLLYLPAGAEAPPLSLYQGWRLILDLERLTRLATQLAEHRLSPARLRKPLLQWRLLQPDTAQEQDLSGALRHLLQLSDSSALREQRQLELVGLDLAIQRVVLLLLCGDLIQAARKGEGDGESSGKSRIFDELLAWIQANLHRPLQMQELVDQSGYSQRSLRNFFQERCGCGPVQWIRSQRLQAARLRLLSPGPHDTVSSIAAQFGYSYLSQFSRDFQSVYRIKPSELLREGQRGGATP